jgi:hypothetical protein
MATITMGKAVSRAEGRIPRVLDVSLNPTAANYLVSRLFTDAIFNQDIRVIQQIITRIDGGLPKDEDLSHYQTYFGDCINEVLEMDSADQMKIVPEDTVMMAMCKSLYDLAVQDIYWDDEKQCKCKPSSDKKQERDAAMRIILERCGGRKTQTVVKKDQETYGIASWITKNLPEADTTVYTVQPEEKEVVNG